MMVESIYLILFALNHVCFDSFGIYRFHSEGQIAAHGFTNPTFSKSHWIIFDEDTFAHLWLELNSISFYVRIKEDFS